MNKYEILNHETGIICTYQQEIQPEYNAEFGKLARWIPIDQASNFEKSREDDRREILIQAEIPEYLDEDNVLHPAIPAVYRTEIHVPDDFTVTITDITSQYQKELEKRKLKRKKEMSDEIIIHINYVIRDLTKEDKINLLGRNDIRIAYDFLDKGSIEDTRTLVGILPLDSLLTQERKDSVYDFITEKINEYNAIIWT